MNALAQVLIYFGIIGFIPFYLFIKKIFIGKSKLIKSLVIAFGLMCVSSSVLFDTYWVLYLAIIFSFIYSKDRHKEEISYEQ
jgi:formate hydrogenlyase subunit 3/multisubunit Na+/H+ antiporter MnhD subunit